MGSLESNFNVIWENKTSRKILHQILVYSPILLVFGDLLNFAGVVSQIQNTLSLIVIEGLHFTENDLGILINAFWWIALNFGVVLVIFLMLYALPSRPTKIPGKSCY